MYIFFKFFVIVACLFMIYSSSEAYETFASVVGCKIVLRWRSTQYDLFQVVIRKKDGPKYSLSLVTEANSFTYHDAEPDQTYSVAWIPVEGNNRQISWLKKEENVTVRNDCMNQASLSTPKLSQNKSTSTLPDCFSHSPTVPPIHLGSTKSDFCRIYFWTSLSSIPVLACIVSVTLYLCVIRKPQKTIQNGNDLTQKRSDVNVKSACYANDDENEYHEVQYCLAQYTEN